MWQEYLSVSSILPQKPTLSRVSRYSSGADVLGMQKVRNLRTFAWSGTYVEFFEIRVTYYSVRVNARSFALRDARFSYISFSDGITGFFVRIIPLCSFAFVLKKFFTIRSSKE